MSCSPWRTRLNISCISKTFCGGGDDGGNDVVVLSGGGDGGVDDGVREHNIIQSFKHPVAHQEILL